MKESRQSLLAVICTLAVSLVFCLVFGQMTKPKIAAPAEGALFAAGTYEAESPGYTGASNPIKVKVTVSDNKIENIEYTIDGETPTVGGMAVPALAEKVLAVQSPNIDIVTNATVSSKGFLTDVSDAFVRLVPILMLLYRSRSRQLLKMSRRQQILLLQVPEVPV